MRTRQHQRFSHPLEPGHDSDMGCGACLREAAHGTAPKITDSSARGILVAHAARAGRAAGEEQGTDCTGAWIEWGAKQGIDTSDPGSGSAYLEFAIAYCEEAKLRLEREIAMLKGARRHLEQK